MAEFCLDCWNDLNGEDLTERDVVLSRDYELCEGCGEFCRVVEGERTFKLLYDLTHWKQRKKK